MKTREHYKFKVSTNISDLKTNTVWYPGMAIGLHSNVFSHKSQWRGALIFSLICVWTNSWANNQDSGDLKRHRAHFDVTVVTAGLFSICSEKGLIEAVSVQGYRLISIRIPSIRINWSYDRLILNEYQYLEIRSLYWNRILKPENLAGKMYLSTYMNFH